MPAPAQVRPVPLPQPEDVAALPRPFDACARCGYLGVRALTHEDGAWAGTGALLSARVCERCGFEGLPVEFQAAEEYLAFLDELHATAPRTQPF